MFYAPVNDQITNVPFLTPFHHIIYIYLLKITGNFECFDNQKLILIIIHSQFLIHHFNFNYRYSILTLIFIILSYCHHICYNNASFPIIQSCVIVNNVITLISEQINHLILHNYNIKIN